MELAFTQWKSKTLEKAKILLLHGMGGTGSIWRPIAVHLEDEFHILAPDQRGHGESQAPQTSYEPKDFGQDVLDLMSHQNFHPAWVVGHSMGARTACALATLKPQWLKGLVIVDLGFHGLAGGGFGKNLSSLLKVLPMTFQTREEARKFLAEHSPDAAISNYLMAVSKPDDPRNLSGAIRFPFDRDALLKTLASAQGTSLRPWIEQLGKSGLKILALRGEFSSVWSKSDYEEERLMFSSYPNVIFEEFKGTGHGLPFEKRKEFVARLRDFILHGR